MVLTPYLITWVVQLFSIKILETGVPQLDEAAENAKIMRSIILLHDLSNPLLFHGQRSFTSGIIFLTIYDFTHSQHYIHIWDEKSGKKCRNLEMPANFPFLGLSVYAPPMQVLNNHFHFCLHENFTKICQKPSLNIKIEILEILIGSLRLLKYVLIFEFHVSKM